jgi:hypothetical protein
VSHLASGPDTPSSDDTQKFKAPVLAPCLSANLPSTFGPRKGHLVFLSRGDGAGIDYPSAAVIQGVMHHSDLYLPVPPVTSRFAPPVRLPAPASTSAWPQSISNSTIPKKRNVERACDGCRRRKTRCDGPKMPDNVCTNCIQNRKICTYVLAQTFVEYALSLTVLSAVRLPSLGVPPKRLSCLAVVRFQASHSHASNSYITSLEDRMEKMEALLKRVRMSSWARTPKPPNTPLWVMSGRVTLTLKRGVKQ